MKPFELRKVQRQILEHVRDAGELADLAGVLVKFVYELSPDCYFEPLNVRASEWVLREKNWIGLYFSTGRHGYDSKIIVSLDIWPGNASGGETLKVRQGRKPSWSKVTVQSVKTLPDLIDLIVQTHNVSG